MKYNYKLFYIRSFSKFCYSVKQKIEPWASPEFCGSVCRYYATLVYQTCTSASFVLM